MRLIEEVQPMEAIMIRLIIDFVIALIMINVIIDYHDDEQVKEASGVTLANEDVFMATQFGEFIR